MPLLEVPENYKHSDVNVWLVKSGEPLQTDPGVTRLMRTGYLSEFLADREVSVTWWTSNFDHQKKCFRSLSSDKGILPKNINIKLIKSLGYTRNVSLRRWFDDIALGWRILRRMNSEEKLPHVIICSYPLIFVSYAVSLYAKKRKIPLILDVRDMWPDIFIYTNGKLRQAAMRIFSSLQQPLVRKTFTSAYGIVGITDSFLQWGLGKANRKKTKFDKVFPLTSEPVRVSEDEVNAAKIFWESLGVYPDMKIFCYFGVFSEKVDLLTVISAASKLSVESNIKIVLCGTGDDFEKTSAFGKNVNNVIMPGWIDPVQIRVLMEMSIGGLAPFKRRMDFLSSIPNKVIEYLSAGLPVIAGIGGEMKHLIDQYDCGVIYREKDVDSLVLIFESMSLDCQCVKNISDNAFFAYKKEFDFDSNYKDFAAYVLSIPHGSSVSNKYD
jgi:glycosyltransferase involved in cell wall biosynthesis